MNSFEILQRKWGYNQQPWDFGLDFVFSKLIMVENSHWAEGLGEYSAVWGADNKKNGAENVQR